MAKKEVGPGVKCRIIGTSIGPSGKSMGMIVKVVGRADPPNHVVWGPMWDVEAVDGRSFQVKITSPDMQDSHLRESKNSVCATDWLEPLDEDTLPPKVQEREKDLDLTH